LHNPVNKQTDKLINVNENITSFDAVGWLTWRASSL